MTPSVWAQVSDGTVTVDGPHVTAAHGVVLDADAVAVRAPGTATRFYRHGWHSFSMARWVDLDRQPEIVTSEVLRIGGDDPAHGLSTRHGGSAVGAVDAGGDRILLVGALCLGGRVEWTGDALEGTCAEPPGRWFVGYGSEDEVFAGYVAQLRERFGARQAPAPRTWMSWYSFYEEIDEARLAAVLADLRGLDVDCFVVDDGWERSVGDWRVGPGFPSGMDRFARRVREAGLDAGLWLAPFLAPAGAPVFVEHPEWFVCDDAGAPARAGVNWGADYFGLDLTHPAALDYIVELLREVVGWGYSVLKLDFLFAGAIPGRRSRPVGREHAFRAGVETIRAAVGDDVRLLACGAPIIPSLGVFDAIRIGPDVAPWWENGLAAHLHVHTEPATREAIATSLHRLWLAPLIACDPDVAYVRSRQLILSEPQRELLRDLARICDCRSTSDPPSWLDPEELVTLQRFFTRPGEVTRRGRYRWVVDDREVDFTAVVEG